MIVLSELKQAYIDIIHIIFVLNDMPCLPPLLCYQLLERETGLYLALFSYRLSPVLNMQKG